MNDKKTLETLRKLGFYGKTEEIIKLEALEEHKSTLIKIWNEENIKGLKYFFTIGYGNKPIVLFLELLDTYSINILIDVRVYPKAHTNHYSRPNIEKILAKIGIQYHWIKKFGNTFKNNGNPLGYYKAHLETEHTRILAKLDGLIKKNRVCFMCAENDPKKCHRSILSNKIIETWSEFRVIHLGA